MGGIRPENIHDEEAFLNASPETTIDVSVEIVELMGSETYLYLKTSGKDDNIVAGRPRSTARGRIRSRGLRHNRMRCFDADTESTILER